MEEENQLVQLMQRRAVLKSEIRAWSKSIQKATGCEPTPADCEQNRSTLAEYRAVKQAIEKIISPDNTPAPVVSPPPVETSTLALSTSGSSWFSDPLASVASLVSTEVSDVASSTASWLMSATEANSSDWLSAFWEGIPHFGSDEQDNAEPIAVAAPINDTSVPVWQQRYRERGQATPMDSAEGEAAAAEEKSSGGANPEVAAAEDDSEEEEEEGREDDEAVRRQREEEDRAEMLETLVTSSMPLAEKLTRLAAFKEMGWFAGDVAAFTECKQRILRAAPKLAEQVRNENPAKQQPTAETNTAAEEAPCQESGSARATTPMAPAPAPTAAPTPPAIPAAAAVPSPQQPAAAAPQASATPELAPPAVSATVPPPATPSGTATSAAAAEDDVEATKKDEAFKTMIDRAVRQFNLSAKKGVKFIIASGMVSTPAEVADFLCNTRGLNKAQIGEYLGDPSDFNLKVLQILARMFQFGTSFISAIRAFLARFRLPGEAQKIDRILEAFADAFFEATTTTASNNGGATNPAAAAAVTFSSASTIHILAFSVIMLNTDAHNPSIAKKNKMTKEQFVKNNRGIDEGKDLPRNMLEEMYEEISTNEILTQTERDDEGNLFSNPRMTGWLDKAPPGGTVMGAGWRARHFILSGGMLYYFRQPQDLDPVGFIMINDVIADASATAMTKVSRSSSLSAAAVAASAPLGTGGESGGSSSSASSSAATVKSWVTTEEEVSRFIDPTISNNSSSSSSAGVPPLSPSSSSSSSSSSPCLGQHVTFKGAAGQKLGVSLRSRGRRSLPVVESSSTVSGLEKGSVLVAIDGQRVLDFSNPVSDAIALSRGHQGLITLSFVPAATEAKLTEKEPWKWKNASKETTQESAVVFSSEGHDAKAAGSSSSATTAYITIVPTFGSKVKSVKYNKKRELVPGSHEVVRLRVKSTKLAEDWVAAINEVATHTVCSV